MLDTSFTPPCIGMPPHQFTPPTHWLASLCISMFWGYLYVIWKIFLMLGFGDGPPSVGGFGGISTWGVHMLSLVNSCRSLCLMLLLWL